jgi:sugar lactone lactonase YvrE
VALADPADPRIGSTASAPPAATAAPASPIPANVRVLSTDPVAGQTLLLTTAVAPDGTMYVTDMANSRILVRSPKGKVEQWGEFGSGPGEFNFTEVTRNDNASGVAVSPDGKLIAVGDGANHRVQLFDRDRKYIRSIGRLGRDDGQFVNPCCLAIDEQHRIWVVDAGREDVQVFSEAGKHLLTFAGSGHGGGQLSRPSSIVVDLTANRVYVGDFANRRVAVFATDGTWIDGFGGVMANGQQLGETNDVEVDRSGRMFVLEDSGRIHVLAPDGTPIATISNQYPDIGVVEVATFALDNAGRLYFADIGDGTRARLVVAQLEAPLWPPA